MNNMRTQECFTYSTTGLSFYKACLIFVLISWKHLHDEWSFQLVIKKHLLDLESVKNFQVTEFFAFLSLHNTVVYHMRNLVQEYFGAYVEHLHGKACTNPNSDLFLVLLHYATVDTDVMLNYSFIREVLYAVITLQQPI